MNKYKLTFFSVPGVEQDLAAVYQHGQLPTFWQLSLFWADWPCLHPFLYPHFPPSLVNTEANTEPARPPEPLCPLALSPGFLCVKTLELSELKKKSSWGNPCPILIKHFYFTELLKKTNLLCPIPTKNEASGVDVVPSSREWHRIKFLEVGIWPVWIWRVKIKKIIKWVCKKFRKISLVKMRLVQGERFAQHLPSANFHPVSCSHVKGWVNGMKDNIFVLNSWLSEDFPWLGKIATVLHSKNV